jgi:hypothetical protein
VKDSTDDLWFLEETDDDGIGDNFVRHLSDSDVYANEYELVSEPDDDAEQSDSDHFSDSSHCQVCSVSEYIIEGIVYSCCN